MRTNAEFRSWFFAGRLLFLLLPLVSGCATHALWDEVSLDSWNEPASKPNLRLFHAERKKDFLVVYDEYRERPDTIRTHAYLLNRNRTQIESRQRPHFVRTNLLSRLPSVPILQPSAPLDTNSAEKVYAVAAADGQSFKMYSAAREVSFNELPVYNDGVGQAARIALTPVAVVADVTIVGGFLFLWFWSGGGLSDVH